MQEYALIMLAGALGSFHCVGMCGGFACALGYQQNQRKTAVPRLLLYNLGRLTTYVFLGALGGLVGMHVMTGGAAFFSVATGQRTLAVLSGLLMLLMGLQLLGWMPRMKRMPFSLAGNFFANAPFTGISAQGFSLTGALQATVSRPGPAAPLALGVFNGFLPCPLVYAFLAQAAGALGPAQGMAIMAFFGLGTFPAMMAMGLLSRALGTSWRRTGVNLAGALVLVLGAVTLLRGLLATGTHGMNHSGLMGPILQLFTV